MFVLAVTAAILVGCGEPPAAPTSSVVQVEGELAKFWAWDPCFTDASYSCHDAPTFWGGGFDPYAESFNCPDGCRTVGLGAALKTKARNVIENRIKHTQPGCEWLKGFLTASLNYSRIRWYPYYDGNYGDFHPPESGMDGSPYTNDIHIYANTWLNDTELVKTLIHEAAHIYYQTYSATQVDSVMNACYVP